MIRISAKAATGATLALLASTAITQAGGVELNPQTTSMLFEEGTFVEFGYTFVSPDVSGTQVFDPTAFGAPINTLPTFAGATSGDVAPSYSHMNLGFRTDISDEISVALMIDEPIGASVDYSGGFVPGYLYGFGQGSTAELSSHQLTLAARYEMPTGFSVYGGVRVVSFEGAVELFNLSGGAANPATRYLLDADASTEIGYMLGAAYERPDIALRVALTYYSATTHEVAATETTDIFGTRGTTFDAVIPQQVLLEAQSGVAPGTLVFGSVRWTDWTEFDIAPNDYTVAVSNGRALVKYDEDVWTWTIGGARVLTDQWTVLGSLTYEAEQDNFSGNLGPTDGRTSLGVGARYTHGPWRITGGVNYTWVGDAETEAPAFGGLVPDGLTFARFRENTAVGYGVRVGYSF